VRAVIAEDNPLMLQGIAHVLSDAGFEMAAAVTTADELLESVAAFRPDIAIIDVRLPPSQSDEGARAARRLRQEHPEVSVLLLSQVVEVAHARHLFSESPRGFGYLLKDRVLDIDEFLQSVRRVARGGTAIDPDVVSQLLGGSRARDPNALDELSPRELEVLALMAEGLSNRGICGKLFLSAKTVETHVTSIFAKLNLPIAEDDHRRVRAVLTYLSVSAEKAIADDGQGTP
jgi:DNA-binding NarL/FixJ family response regulator